MAEIAGLKYVGAGAYRPGIPARDLDKGEVAALHPDVLSQAVGSGLYLAQYEPEEEAVPEAVAVEDLTKAQLVALAGEAGVEIDPKMTKAEIREALAAHAANAETDPVTEPGEGGKG